MSTDNKPESSATPSTVESSTAESSDTASSATAQKQGGTQTPAASSKPATGSLDASLSAKAKKTKKPAGAGTSGTSATSATTTASVTRRNRIIAIVALVVVIAVVAAFLIARRGSNDTNATSNPNANAAATVPVDDAEITIGMVLSPTNLDIRTQSGSSLDQLLIGNVYEPLVSRDENNAVQPGLASSWDVSDDGTVYTFHLNSGITFSNGDALDADDVAWSISELENNQYKDYDAIANYESVEAVDSDTVRLTLSAPYSQLLWNLTGRAGLVFDKDASYDAKTQAVGSGPYLLEKFTANDSAQLTANKDYWGANKAQIGTVTIKYYTDANAAINAIRSGDIQTLSGFDYTQVSPLKDEGFNVEAGDDTDKMVLAFNNARSPLNDIRVRQAIRYAIDEDDIIAARGGVDTALGGPIPSLDPGYEDLTDLYPHDVDKARELLSEAGYGADNPLKITLTYANIYSSEIGDALTSQLADAGIELTINQVEFSTWLSDVYTNHDYDLSLVDHNESHDFGQWANPDYYYGYDNAQVQEDYTKALASTDEGETDSLLAQAARQVSEDAAADWLFNFRVVSVWSGKVQGFPVNMNQTYLPLWQISLLQG